MAPRRLSGVNLSGMITVFRREIRREWRFFQYTMLGPALQAVLFATVFLLAAGENISTMGGVPYLEFLAPGLVISAALQRSFESTGFSLMEDKLQGTIGDLLGAPLWAVEILVAQTLSAIMIAVAIATSVWIGMMFFGLVAPVNLPLALLFLTGGAMLFSATGILASMFARKWDGLAAWEVFLLMPLLFLSGTFFAPEVVSEEYRFLLSFNPVFFIVDGFRGAMIGTGHVDPQTALAVTFGCAFSLWSIVLVLYHKGIKLKA